MCAVFKTKLHCPAFTEDLPHTGQSTLHNTLDVTETYPGCHGSNCLTSSVLSSSSYTLVPMAAIVNRLCFLCEL